jgi:LuxR family transcriptional regulator, maltose regulon positive regulatory protein
MHLVIATREDPPLPLARLRARAQLTELREMDLRFAQDEATEFFNVGMGLNLSAQDIFALESRTEGWIAGLQLAALSMQGQSDLSDIIESFSGTHHFVLDYLVEEVLNRQSEHIQSFLLRTSILERLSGALCDALMTEEETSGQGILETIHQANLFLIPLDHERQWYRYHHLFRDLLRQRLQIQMNDIQINELHRKASEWYEDHNLRPEAIHHALIAEDFDRAADLVELAWSETHTGTFYSQEYRKWMRALPDDEISNRPVLSTGYAWTLLDFGELDAVDTYLQNAEQYFTPTGEVKDSASDMIVIDDEEFQRLPATMAAARTYLALAMGNIPDTIKHAERVLVLTSEDEHHQRGMAASLLGLAYWSIGNLDRAYQSMYDGMANMLKMGNVAFALSSTFGLADIQIAQGRLHDAIHTYEQSLQFANEQSTIVQGMADLYMGLGDLYREQNDLESAREYLLKSENLGEQAGLPDWRYRFCRIQSRMKQTMGDFDSALDLLNEAERLYYITPVPNIRPTPTMKARIWIEQGHIEKALAWAHEHGLSVESELTYLNEFNLITLARIQLSQYQQGRLDSSNDVSHLLENLLESAETGERQGSLIEILVLQALLQQAENDMDSAFMSLERALSLAESEGYVRIFVDEGQLMIGLLTEAVAREISPDYTRKLLSAFNASSSKLPTSSPQALIEPLSERELEVLQLIAEGLSNREISEKLFLALSTVKGHNRNIFDKLGVKRRTEAVARANDLDLI